VTLWPTVTRTIETLVAGLDLVRRTRAYAKAMALRGKIHLKIDLATSRERPRR
jgi:hypothetical protein